MTFSQTQHHMGTEVEISIFDTTVPQEKIKSDIKSAFQIFQNMQQEFSRFQQDSCLTKLNEKKSAEVSDIFLEVLQKSQYFFELTGGYFNPLISLESIGYDKSFTHLPKERKEYSFSPTEEYDFQNIRIEDHTVHLKAEHNLDFGGIVKGYTVDTVRDFFWEQ